VSASVSHADDFERPIPDRLPITTVRELSRLEPWRAIATIAIEWLCIVGAIVALERWWHPLVFLLAIVWIGARQHALTVISHDAVHRRLFAGRVVNDWAGELLCAWPTFLNLDAFRHVHGLHHRDLAGPKDGNRWAWRTHDSQGRVLPSWRFPKTRLQLLLVLVQRGAFVTGAFWIVRGFVSGFLYYRSTSHIVLRSSYYAVAAGVVTWAGCWSRFALYWLVPYCTWHIVAQYIRLICEHSAIPSTDPVYGLTRTTVPPLWQRWLVLPRNIHYHIEHHFYPSIPFYNLPALHARLMQQSGFRERAVVTHSIGESLGQCVAGLQRNST